MARRNDELELGPAVAGMLAALAEAAGYAGGGLRTTGVRAGRVGARAGRRTWDGAQRSGRRAAVAYRVFRGVEPPTQIRRRPLEFLGLAVAAGAIGAITVLAIQRYQARAAEESRTDEQRDEEPRAAAPRVEEARAVDTGADSSAPATAAPTAGAPAATGPRAGRSGRP